MKSFRGPWKMKFLFNEIWVAGIFSACYRSTNGMVCCLANQGVGRSCNQMLLSCGCGVYYISLVQVHPWEMFLFCLVWSGVDFIFILIKCPVTVPTKTKALGLSNNQLLTVECRPINKLYYGMGQSWTLLIATFSFASSLPLLAPSDDEDLMAIKPKLRVLYVLDGLSFTH